MKEFQYYQYSKLELLEQISFNQKIRSFLSMLSLEYPRFLKWYDDLFSQADLLKVDREILICAGDSGIAGIAILKKTEEEKKICTLRVSPFYQRCGIGKELIGRSLEWLECDKPLITVRGSKASEFKRLFDYYGFHLEQKNFAYYKLFSSELAFNGQLPPKEIHIGGLELVNWSELINRILKGENASVASVERMISAWYRNLQYI